MELDFFDATLSAPVAVTKPHLRVARLVWHIDPHSSLISARTGTWSRP